MKVLHIFPISQFTSQFITKYNKCFNSKENFFILYGKKVPGRKNMYKLDVPPSMLKNVYRCNDLLEHLPYLERKLIEFDKVILHSLFLPEGVIAFLSLQPWFWKKYIWFIWSSDLYYKATQALHFKRMNSFKQKANSLLTLLLINNLNTIACAFKEDYTFAKKHFSIKAKYRYAYYPFILPAALISNQSFSDKNNITILVGHSSDPVNQHVAIFGYLSIYKDKNIRVICPLAYGDEEYAKKVVNLGQSIFGNKFFALTEFLDYNEYIKILSSVDIAIFHPKVHRAGGNTYLLLFLGKKVYMNKNISVYKQLLEENYLIFPTTDISKDNFFTDLTAEEKKYNREKIVQKMSDETFFNTWNNVIR